MPLLSKIVKKQDVFKILEDISFGQEKRKIPIYNYYNLQSLDPNLKYITHCRRRPEHIDTVSFSIWPRNYCSSGRMLQLQTGWMQHSKMLVLGQFYNSTSVKYL